MLEVFPDCSFEPTMPQRFGIEAEAAAAAPRWLKSLSFLSLFASLTLLLFPEYPGLSMMQSVAPTE